MVLSARASFGDVGRQGDACRAEGGADVTALMSFVKPKDERNCQTLRDAWFSRDVRISVGARPGTLLNKL